MNLKLLFLFNSKKLRRKILKAKKKEVRGGK
jgi:hypothetical protein